MRITTKLTTAGEAGFLSMPRMPHPAEYYSADGHPNEELMRRDLAHTPEVQINSDDNVATIALAVELLDRMRISLERMMTDDSGLSKPDPNATSKSTVERRFDRGSVVYVRVDINYRTDGFRIKISTANPKGVVGHAEEFAQIYAQAFADNLVVLTEGLKENGVKSTIIEGDGCIGIVAAAYKRNDDYELKQTYCECSHRKADFCSPPDFKCPLYDKGKCRYNKL